MIEISIQSSKNYFPISSPEFKIIVGNTSDYEMNICGFKKQLSIEEQSRSEKFENSLDAHTFIITHYLLRKALANLLNKSINKIRIRSEYIKKPVLMDYNIDFNISHARGCFAIIIAKTPFILVGIDIENRQRKVDIKSITDNYMHKMEQDYILNQGEKSSSMDRFLEIWTRKEALLKMLGIGIDLQLSKYNLTDGMQLLNFSSDKNIPKNLSEVSISSHIHNNIILSYSTSALT